MAALQVLRPGLLTTVQDLGRWGHQTWGVPVAGPMDAYSHRLANRLVGNREDAAALEVTLIGPELRAIGDVRCAVTGADLDPRADGVRIERARSFDLTSGAVLRFGRRVAGARAYLAVRGGIDVAPVFGSRASHMMSGLGPFGGRALVTGDVLAAGHLLGERDDRPAGMPLPLPSGEARLRAIAGPQDRLFTPEALEIFFSARFQVTPSSNRMGYRLEGPALAHTDSADILPEATPMGSIQVPGAGQPILLMADRQTTGGYPKIATVITADLPIAGQLAPGDWIRFERCTRARAIEALHQLARRLSGRS